MSCQALLPNFTLPAGFKVGELPPDYSQPLPLQSGCAGSFYVFDYVAAEVLRENGTTVAPGFVGCGLDTAGRPALAICNVSACLPPPEATHWWDDIPEEAWFGAAAVGGVLVGGLLAAFSMRATRWCAFPPDPAHLTLTLLCAQGMLLDCDAATLTTCGSTASGRASRSAPHDERVRRSDGAAGLEGPLRWPLDVTDGGSVAIAGPLSQ